MLRSIGVRVWHSRTKIQRVFELPQPGVLISKRHIENALSRKRLGIVSERELVLWATMILLNEAYEIDSTDEDLIAEWLNDLSLELDPTIEDRR